MKGICYTEFCREDTEYHRVFLLHFFTDEIWCFTVFLSLENSERLCAELYVTLCLFYRALYLPLKDYKLTLCNSVPNSM